MSQHTHGRINPQLRRARQQVAEDQQLCFGQLLPRATVETALQRHSVVFRQCLYTPLLTVWTFLHQVLAADSSCRAAVARLLAFAGMAGENDVSAKTDPYCKARQRLPEQMLADLARQSGQDLQQQVPATGLLQNRPIKIADGTTLSMPDTPANQKAYPQPRTQKAGVGFPILRVVGVMCLSCGAMLDVAMGPWRGKQTGETALLRQVLGALRAGEILLADAYFSNYWMLALLGQQGVDALMYHDGKRRVDFRTGRRLGPEDHVACWSKPPPPKWMSRRMYRAMPQDLSVREVKVAVVQRGFRTRQLLLITTLLDAQLYPPSDLAAAYRARWNAELDLRSIKQVMQMDVLRCKTPAMVRKEVWMHLLGYNLVRTLMAQAAAEAKIAPRQISFQGTLQTLLAFAAAGVCGASATRREELYQAILKAVATHRVGDRPDRFEPRAVKRRPKTQTFLNEPRALATERLLKRS